MAYVALLEFYGWFCPLTPLEQRLRDVAGEQGYAGGFIDHYLVKIIYPPGLTDTMQIGLGILVLAVNAGIYSWMIGRLAKGEMKREGALRQGRAPGG